MEKVIVTGATSMIGIALIQHLLKENIDVLAIVRENSNKKDILPKNDKIKIVECDLKNLEKLQIENEKYDVMIHLAWDGTVGNSRNDVYGQNLNVKYSLDALELAKRLGCKRFIGAGSQAEYGRVEGKVGPKTPVNPENGYGMAKLCANKLTNILAHKLGIEHIWLRIISSYGPFDNYTTMIMQSLVAMIDNNQSPEYTKAEQMWDYIYVGDVAKAIYLIAQNGKPDSIYCIGSGKQRPLYEFIKIIKGKINPSIELKIGAKEYSDKQVMNLCADITNLTEDTGFIPEVEFEDGIIKTIEWYKKERLKK